MGVVGAKLGTKSFGEVTGLSSDRPATGSGGNLSARDMQNLGEENVGAVANKLSNPNWVDPSKKLRTAGNNQLDKDAFFKLMLAQMKNQDPTNPMQSHEMAAQLANFSSLEQMQNMNGTLTDMRNAQKPSENFQALNLIGKAISGDSSKVIHTNADKEHDFRFNLMQEASEAEVKVRNADGEIIRKYNLKGLKKGDNKVVWNGQDDRGNKVLPGEYQFFVEAKGSAGTKIAIKTDFDGLISGVSYSSEGPIIHVGNQTVRMSDVKKITDPSLMKNDQKINDVTSQDLKKATTSGENNVSGGVDASTQALAKSKIMDSVGLSRDMINRLDKETQ